MSTKKANVKGVRRKSVKKRSVKKKAVRRRNRHQINQFKNKFESRISEELHAKGATPQYETFTIPYTQHKTYKPDFKIKGSRGTIIIEAKGLFDAEDRRKHREVREQHPEYDIRFIFYGDYKISKKSKTRYSDWCKKNGFLCAINHVPDEWLEDIGVVNE